MRADSISSQPVSAGNAGVVPEVLLEKGKLKNCLLDYIDIFWAKIKEPLKELNVGFEPGSKLNADHVSSINKAAKSLNEAVKKLSKTEKTKITCLGDEYTVVIQSIIKICENTATFKPNKFKPLITLQNTLIGLIKEESSKKESFLERLTGVFSSGGPSSSDTMKLLQDYS
ncbi:hypothetical protein SK355_01885 [Candidatus Fukatsuia symbiotica]|uniref:Uncharacterized protein n=1 Tax=Candidatus Fukatsuia symbiotica TaxID=1878942 RepID=A0A2U8I7W1_9GAMM|nr:hypothetical protein [Candidatus Fukatsuia symbiotica]AWK15260.1 hypothetical protein CCS41_13485 [Candidatus Fukatsuia symbiotica]MEA9444094.1 hypothetical protein [Candidatus Fukatsuia symbiotica]